LLTVSSNGKETWRSKALLLSSIRRKMGQTRVDYPP
jgi:hypothetical protein